MPSARGQARGNSGVFLQGMHELQILDSYGLKPRDNECGAIYKQVAPSVNACRPPRQWQTYDVTFHKAQFDQGKIVGKARVTVVHNGIKTIDNAEVTPTPGGVENPPGEDGPLLLQDHGDRVEYRNIWINHLRKPRTCSRPTQMVAPLTQGLTSRQCPLPTSLARNRLNAKPAITVRSPSRSAQVVSGSWKVEDNELVQKDEAGTILLGDKELSSYDLKFQGQIMAGNEGFVALFHRTSDDNVRFFHVGELDGKRADLGFLHQGKEGGRAKPISTVKGRWYHVLVKVRGAESLCFLDGQELFHAIDNRFTHGRVGLATWDASARFREISIDHSGRGNLFGVVYHSYRAIDHRGEKNGDAT